MSECSEGAGGPGGVELSVSQTHACSTRALAAYVCRRPARACPCTHRSYHLWEGVVGWPVAADAVCLVRRGLGLGLTDLGPWPLSLYVNTDIMVKPDGVARNLVGEIISRFEVRIDGGGWMHYRWIDPIGAGWDAGPEPSQIISTDQPPLPSPYVIDPKQQRKGFKLVGLKLMHASQELLAEHYKDLVGWRFGGWSACGDL